MDSSFNRFSTVNPDVHLAVLLSGFYVFTSLFIPHEGHHADLPIWADWAVYMEKHGIRNVYRLHTNTPKGQQPMFIYGPVYMYILHIFGKWQGSAVMIQHKIYQFKAVILLFDIVGIWFALRFLTNKHARPFYALFLLFNAGLLYDTIGWGQNDGAVTCLTLIAVYCALQKRMALSVISLLVALLIKPQPIIFLPVLGLLLLPVIVQSTLKSIALNLVAVIVVAVIILLPFLMAGTAADYWSMLTHTASLYPSASIEAANIWPLLLTEDPYKVSDQVVRFGLTYRQWGLLLFTVSYAVVVFPLMRQTYQLIRGQRTQYDTGLVMLVFGLVPLVFYFFNTQMHERYAHPCVLFLATYALIKGDYMPYIAASIANFWVMERKVSLLRAYRLNELITLEQLAVLFLFVLAWGTVQLYRIPAQQTTEASPVQKAGFSQP